MRLYFRCNSHKFVLTNHKTKENLSCYIVFFLLLQDSPGLQETAPHRMSTELAWFESAGHRKTCFLSKAVSFVLRQQLQVGHHGQVVRGLRIHDKHTSTTSKCGECRM